MVKDNMFNEEARRKEHGFSAESQSLVIERRIRNKSRQQYNNTSQGISQEECPGLGKRLNAIIVARQGT